MTHNGQNNQPLRRADQEFSINGPNVENFRVIMKFEHESLLKSIMYWIIS